MSNHQETSSEVDDTASLRHRAFRDDLAESLLSPATRQVHADGNEFLTLASSSTAPSTIVRLAVNNDQASSSSGIWIPPVAPAVVVVDNDGGDEHDSLQEVPSSADDKSDRNSSYTYPVATFVRDLVRTGMENVQDARIAANAHAADVAANTMAARSSSNPFMVDDEAEFILVDGDLIAIPRPPPDQQEQERLEDILQQGDDSNRASRPTRFRRGVHKLNKLFRRRKEDGDRLSVSSEFLSTSNHAPEATTAIALASVGPPRSPIAGSAGTTSAAANGAAALSMAEPSTLPPNVVSSPTLTSVPSVPLKKTRIKMPSWRQQQQRDVAAAFGGNRGPPESSPSLPSYVDALAPPTPELLLLGQPALGTAIGHGFADGRTASATASFVGTADQLLQEADVMSAAVSVEAYVEFDDPFSKKDEASATIHSLVPRDADYKVDKADALDVEYMLRRAAYEATNDIEVSEQPAPYRQRTAAGKTTGTSIPLSVSCVSDESSLVHNDMLKIVMVGCHFEKSWLARAIRQCTKRPRKRSTLGVDVHTWSPPVPDGDPLKFSLWDVQGATNTIDGSSNFGAHPATQSLFFSGQTLYILVYDLAVNNSKAHLRRANETGYDEEDDYDDDFAHEEANRHANRALQADIQSRVLSWVDCIARCGPKSAILPVAVVPEGMCRDDVKRRSTMLQNLVEERVGAFSGHANAMKLLTGEEGVLCVNYTDGEGIEQLREMIVAIATDTSQAVFEHVGMRVTAGTTVVYDVIRRLKQDHKLILLDHLLAEVGDALEVDHLVTILEFLDSIGEILYYSVGDEVLSRYVILSRKWLVSALSCILRNDLNRELEETRRFMNMQCLYSEHKFQENDVVKALVSGPVSSCPLLSDGDANMLWQSMSFMREASDRYSQLGEDSTTAPSMFYFLEKLLIHMGIFVPLGKSHGTLDDSDVFFVPSLLAQVDPRDVWSFRSSESWTCVLSNSWLFKFGAPSNLMEHITVELLEVLFKFSNTFQSPSRPQAIKRAKTLPSRGPSLHEFYEEHNEQAVGRVRIHQVMCWQSSALVKIGTVFADKESDQLRESFVELLVAVVDQSSNLCVASDAMRSGMHRVIVSGKGQIGHHGRKLWEGGYKVVMDSVRSTMEGYANVDSQIVCPECLAHSLPHSACTWSQDSVLAVAEGGSAVVRCMRGHRVDSNLICGRGNDQPLSVPPVESATGLRHSKPVSEMVDSVVLVGLYDPRTESIASVGSGFVVDRKLGLVVTAGHVLFNMEDGRQFGTPCFGIKGARVVIGVSKGDGHIAVFRYFAEIVADDIRSVDAAVVRITSRLQNDNSDDGPGLAHQQEQQLDTSAMQDENLKSLKLTSRSELEEAVRILGFNQGGEGIFEKGKHLNRSFDLAKGYVCKMFKAAMSDDSSSHSSDSSSHNTFTPREEIVVICPTIGGHRYVKGENHPCFRCRCRSTCLLSGRKSGGPCVNDEGKVIGILSRADPVDRQRCYLVPSNEIKILVTKARKLITRPSAVGLPSTLKSVQPARLVGTSSQGRQLPRGVHSET